ncbi:MAG: SemiSWEET transporter [Nanoarchaeota archaeon]
MDFVDLVGFAAGACTTLAFLPQVMKVWKTKHTKDLSLGLFSLFLVGIILWLFYGVVAGSLPIIMANFITFIFVFILLVFKIKYG